MNHQTDAPHQHQQSAEFHSIQQLGRRSGPRPTSSGFFSFLRWFRRGENGSNTSESEEESAPPSPLFSSCDSLDSVFSTATATSFAYVPPAIYRPFGTASVPEKFIAPGQETHTYRRRLKQRDRLRELDRNLTLRKKYRLFATETLTCDKTSSHLEYKNYCELSLPHIRQVESTSSNIEKNIKGHRRSASDSSKDKKSGAYLHVKGKRRAPLPPTKYEDLNISIIPDSYGTLPNTPSSTNTRKKRKAPLPPIIKNEELVKSQEKVSNMDTPSTSAVGNNNCEEIISNDSLKLEKGVLKSAKKPTAIEEISLMKPIKDVPPVSPRPWYKRAGNSKEHRRDKTLEKYKDKEKNTFPDFKGYNNDGNTRFSFFSKLNDKSDRKDTEKRKSGMSMLANISELDREAAEIVNTQHAREQAMATVQDDQFYDIPGFIRTRIIENEVIEEEMPKRQSARELISRFNAITNVTKITVNAAFLNTKDSRLFSKNSNKFSNQNFARNEDVSSPVPAFSNKSAITPPMKRSIFSIPNSYNFQTKSSSAATEICEDDNNYFAGGNDVSMVKGKFVKETPEKQPCSDLSENVTNLENSAKPLHIELSKLNTSKTWVCQRCTLHNLRWRSVCDACNMPRPSLEQNGDDIKRPKSPPGANQDQKTDAARKTFDDWEKEIKKYFPNKTKNAMDESLIKKSSSDKSVFKCKIDEKSSKKVKERPITSTNAETPNPPNQNLDVTTHESDIKNNKVLVKPNMEEIRKIRLARFSANLESLSNDQTNTLEGATEQDRLFEKLREMKNSLHKPVNKTKKGIVINKENDNIKVLNASPDDSQKVSSSYARNSENYNKLGAIKKTSNINNKRIQQFDIDKSGYNKDKELLFITMQTELEDIKIRNENMNKPLKVSSSCQTSGVIRKIASDENIAPGIAKSVHEIALPVIPFDLNAPGLRIRNRTYELIGPRDFANMNTYANIPIQRQDHIQSLDNDFDKLTEELRKSKGFPNFKVILQNRDLAINNNTLTINKLLRNLENAIAEGKQMEASQLAKDLANMKVNCSVTRHKHPEQCDQQIFATLDFYVEDKISHQGPFSIQLERAATVRQLKEKIAHDFEIPVIIQRWIIGNQLASDDSKMLVQHGVKDNNAPIYLYLVAPETEDEIVNDNLQLLASKQGIHLPIINNSSKVIEEKNHSHIAYRGAISQNIDDYSNDNEFACNALLEDDEEEAASSKLSNQIKEGSDWTCTTCTLNNSFFNEKCSVCNATKPLEVIRHKKRIKSTVNIKDEHYLQLLNLDNMDVVSNIEPFKCSVCFDDFCMGEGIVLRECLHNFCRECLANNIRYSDEAEVKCPFRDDQYTCDYFLQEREIKALVSPEVYEQHLAKSITQAENRTENAFHCKTPNCLGWCIFEDNVNLFLCPVCTNSNCLTCQVIHTGLDCRQYQEKMKQDSETNVDARRTKEMLKELVDKGEAMTCPTCQVILMKKWGCDWLRCSMCKTEICWVTRGPRWGPKGKGDVTGGCKCGVEGKKCHAKCNYCH